MDVVGVCAGCTNPGFLGSGSNVNSVMVPAELWDHCRVVFSRPTLSYIHLCGDVCVVFASPPLIRAN